MKQKFKFSNSNCRCLVRQNDPGSEYLGDIFHRTAPIPQWHALDQTLPCQILLPFPHPPSPPKKNDRRSLHMPFITALLFNNGLFIKGRH